MTRFFRSAGLAALIAVGALAAAMLKERLVLLLGGVALASLSIWTIVLSIIGFAVMLFGGIMALRTPSNQSSPSARASRQAKPRTQRSASMEESFRRRFEDRQ